MCSPKWACTAQLEINDPIKILINVFILYRSNALDELCAMLLTHLENRRCLNVGHVGRTSRWLVEWRSVADLRASSSPQCTNTSSYSPRYPHSWRLNSGKLYGTTPNGSGHGYQCFLNLYEDSSFRRTLISKSLYILINCLLKNLLLSRLDERCQQNNGTLKRS